MNHIYHLPEHQTLRDQMQRFLDREVEPYGLEWEKPAKCRARCCVKWAKPVSLA